MRCSVALCGGLNMNPRQLKEKDYQTYISDMYKAFKQNEDLDKVQYGRLKTCRG
jgi:hypothetical protein